MSYLNLPSLVIGGIGFNSNSLLRKLDKKAANLRISLRPDLAWSLFLSKISGEIQH